MLILQETSQWMISIDPTEMSCDTAWCLTDNVGGELMGIDSTKKSHDTAYPAGNNSGG